MATGIRESRVYRHLQCGQETVISGQAFEVASNPMSDMTRTWCSTCNAFFPVSDYQWADTGEKISDYYVRHSAKATPGQRFVCSKKFMIICALVGLILGAAGGYFLTRGQRVPVQVLMVPFVGVIGVFITCGLYLAVGKKITKSVCGVSDTRALV